jgi:hypothetical protein
MIAIQKCVIQYYVSMVKKRPLVQPVVILVSMEYISMSVLNVVVIPFALTVKGKHDVIYAGKDFVSMVV